MSFLLDALRKSEQIRRHRSVPTIHGGEPDPPAVRRADDWLPLLAMIVPAFLMMAWFGWDQHGVTGRAAGATVTEVREATEQDVVAAVQATSQPPAPRDSVGSREAAARPVDPDSDAGPPKKKPRAGSAPARTPVERLASDEDRSSRPSAGGEPGAPAERVERQAMPAEAGALAPAPVENRPAVAESPVPRAALVPSAPEGAVQERPNHIDYWQLPDGIRSQLPEFRVTVLVFAEEPSDRFILVNGSRLYEGDALKPGLVLREVRREGAIFSYQAYRFLVAR